VFEQTSANGILLFRQISSILCTYGSRILAVPVQTDIYKEKYKGVRLMLNALVAALSGNYVNFGVFGLYQDDVRTCWIGLLDTTYLLTFVLFVCQALERVLDVSLQLCLQIPFDDVMAYVKLSRAFFGFLEVLFRSHLDVLCALDSVVFLNLIRYCHDGLQAVGKSDRMRVSCTNCLIYSLVLLMQIQRCLRPAPHRLITWPRTCSSI
jgi:exportin-7